MCVFTVWVLAPLTVTVGDLLVVARDKCSQPYGTLTDEHAITGIRIKADTVPYLWSQSAISSYKYGYRYHPLGGKLCLVDLCECIGMYCFWVRKLSFHTKEIVRRFADIISSLQEQLVFSGDPELVPFELAHQEFDTHAVQKSLGRVRDNVRLRSKKCQLSRTCLEDFLVARVDVSARDWSIRCTHIIGQNPFVVFQFTSAVTLRHVLGCSNTFPRLPSPPFPSHVYGRSTQSINYLCSNASQMQNRAYELQDPLWSATVTKIKDEVTCGCN